MPFHRDGVSLNAAPSKAARTDERLSRFLAFVNFSIYSAQPDFVVGIELVF